MSLERRCADDLIRDGYVADVVQRSCGKFKLDFCSVGDVIAFDMQRGVLVVQVTVRKEVKAHARKLAEILNDRDEKKRKRRQGLLDLLLLATRSRLLTVEIWGYLKRHVDSASKRWVPDRFEVLIDEEREALVLTRLHDRFDVDRWPVDIREQQKLD